MRPCAAACSAWSMVRCLIAVGLVCAASASLTVHPALALPRIQQTDISGNLPLSFEKNRGQADESVEFLAHAGDATVLLTRREVVLDGGAGPIRMRFVGARPAPSVVGVDALAGDANYFIGNDPRKWRMHVPTYARVQYRQLYRGVDVAIYGDHQRLEYDIVAVPGADLSVLRLRFTGSNG